MTMLASRAAWWLGAQLGQMLVCLPMASLRQRAFVTSDFSGASVPHVPVLSHSAFYDPPRRSRHARTLSVGA